MIRGPLGSTHPMQADGTLFFPVLPVHCHVLPQSPCTASHIWHGFHCVKHLAHHCAMHAACADLCLSCIDPNPSCAVCCVLCWHAGINAAALQDKSAFEKLVVRLIPRPSPRTVSVGDVVAFQSPLDPSNDHGLMVGARIAVPDSSCLIAVRSP